MVDWAFFSPCYCWLITMRLVWLTGHLKVTIHLMLVDALIFKSFKQISVSLQVIITPEKIDGSIGCQ